MKNKLYLVILLLTVLVSVPAHSQSHIGQSEAGQIVASDNVTESHTQDRDSSKTEQFIIHYRVNEIELDADYMDNKAQLHRIRHYFSNSPRIDSVTIYSWASPEGGIKLNTYLSRERGKNAKKLLLSYSPDSSKFNAGKIKLSPIAENWDGLEKIVEERYFRHDRDKVLQILRTKGISDETRKWRLQQLNEGITWKYLIRRYMPELRAATWICVWAEVIDPMPEVAAVMEAAMKAEMTHQVDSVTIVRPEVKPQIIEQKRTLFALKTNLLYDAGTGLNYAIEVPVADRLSVQFQQHTPWWVTRDNRHCLQFLSLGTELRYWFIPEHRGDNVLGNNLLGHFIGAHVWSGDGDLQWDRFGCYQFTFWSAGLTYGFAIPVGKRFHMEFSLSGGYASIPYQHYIPTEDWQILIKDRNNAGRLHYWGPTKAEVSFVIPITRTTYKTR